MEVGGEGDYIPIATLSPPECDCVPHNRRSSEIQGTALGKCLQA